MVAELATKISFIGSLEPLDRLNSGLISSVTSITKMAGAMTAATIGLTTLVSHTLENTDAQIQLARETDVSVEAIQELGYVASVNGSGMDALQSSLSNLSKKMGEAVTLNNETTKAFKRLGVSLKDGNGHLKTADVMLGEISGKFKELKLSKGEEKAYLEKLGIDSSMLQTLELGADGIDKLRAKAKALGEISTDDANKVASFNDSMTTLSYGVDNVQKKLAIAFAPQLQATADGFTDMLIANKDMIQNGLKKFFSSISTGLGAMYKFGGLLYDVVDKTVGVKNAMYIMGASILYANRAFAMSPIGRVIALVGSLAIVYDDLDVAMRGGKSVIGSWFKEWFDLDIGSVIVGIRDTFRELSDDISNFSFSKMIEDTEREIGVYIDNIVHYFDPIFELWDKITNFSFAGMISKTEDELMAYVDKILGYFKPVTNLFNKIGNFSFSDLNPFSNDEKIKDNAISQKVIKNYTHNNTIDKSSHTYKTDTHNNIYEKNNPNTQVILDAFKMTKIMAVATPPNVANHQNNVQHNTIKIEVKSDNPQVAGQHVATELQDIFKNANMQFSGGGR